MNDWNKLKRQTDVTIGFPNMKSSTLELTGRGVDQRTGEYTFSLLYRVKVNLGMNAPVKTAREIRSPRDLHNNKRRWSSVPLSPFR